MEGANKSDWNNQPLPKKFEKVSLDLHYSSGEMGKVRKGFIPSQMEDKWFIYLSDNVLYCHRSWTGYCIYEVHFKKKEVGYSATHALVNRDPDQYQEVDPKADRHKIHNLIKTYLFDLSFPWGKESSESYPPDCVRIIPAHRFLGQPSPDHRPYAFYADAPSLNGKTITECYRLVLGLSLPPREHPLPRENRTPFLWDQAPVSLESPLVKLRQSGKGGLRASEYPEKKLDSLEFVVLRVPGQVAKWQLDAFPATWTALAFILSDANRMGGQTPSFDIKPTDYAKNRAHALFCDLLAQNDKDRLALMVSKHELGLGDFAALPDLNKELIYYNYANLDPRLLREVTDLFGISYWCWHGGGYIGWPDKPLCRLYFLENRMIDGIQISIAKGKDIFEK